MSRKSNQKRYVPAASMEQIQNACAKVRAVRSASRKPKRLKVEPVMETVVLCLQAGISSRMISALVKNIHQYEIKKDAILRFAKTIPKNSIKHDEPIKLN